MTRRTKSELIAENEELRSRAEEAEETLRAIQSGEVDAIVISTPEGKRVFSLKSAETPYRILMESISEGAVTLTPDGMILYANTRFSEMLGFPLERIIGARFHNFLPGFLKRRLTGLLKRGYRKSAKEESALVTSNGSFLPVYLSARRLALDGRKGLSMVVTDLSERKRAEKALKQAYGELEAKVRERTAELALTNEKLQKEFVERKRIEEEVKHMAHHDSLTGLPNRRFFNDILNFRVAEMNRRRKKLAILFLDLDRFKEINDTLGHDAGDKLLVEIAGRLRASIRGSDTVARIGGDEFNIILSDIARVEDISSIAEKILDSCKEPIALAGHELRISTSIGISIYPDDSTGADELLKYADIAMYHAKENGRNRYKFFDPELNRMVVERIRLEGRLRGTLERGELEVYYQPQIDTVTRKIVCAEALVRWRHPEKGVLTPGEFIPFAEESGFIVEIDEWVLKTACVQVKAWMDSGLPPICLTVNFSARQFQRPEMAERVSLILEETGLSPECLDIEITESIAMSNVEDTIARLGELSDIGVSASLDDFGTGYSSLSSLKRLPVRKLKIDRSFINGIASDRDDRAILTAVLLMARTMDLKVVAEGIEREEQFFYLRSLKCDEAQGFLFSEPLPAEEFGELMAAGK